MVVMWYGTCGGWILCHVAFHLRVLQTCHAHVSTTRYCTIRRAENTSRAVLVTFHKYCTWPRTPHTVSSQHNIHATPTPPHHPSTTTVAHSHAVHASLNVECCFAMSNGKVEEQGDVQPPSTWSLHDPPNASRLAVMQTSLVAVFQSMSTEPQEKRMASALAPLDHEYKLVLMYGLAKWLCTTPLYKTRRTWKDVVTHMLLCRLLVAAFTEDSASQSAGSELQTHLGGTTPALTVSLVVALAQQGALNFLLKFVNQAPALQTHFNELATCCPEVFFRT